MESVTQLLMGLTPIDRGAKKLMPSETRRLLFAGGFDVMQTVSYLSFRGCLMVSLMIELMLRDGSWSSIPGSVKEERIEIVVTNDVTELNLKVQFEMCRFYGS